MIIAEQLYFRFGTIEGTAGLMLMGIAVILGHRRPLFFGFKGGSGLASTIGVLGFFGPVEIVISMLIGAGALLAAYIFLSNIAKAFETIRSGKVDSDTE